MSDNPAPPKDFNMGGSRPTGRIRARTSLFFRLAIIEELWEYSNGTAQWKRIDYPIPLQRGDTP